MLRWQRQWGKHFKTWDKWIEEGRDLPDAYYEQPELAPHLYGLYTAWAELSTERPIGMAPGHIPRSKIIDYLRDELGLSGDKLDHAYRVLRRVDDDYLGTDSSPLDPNLRQLVKPDNPAAVKQMMRRIGNQSVKRNPRKP